MKKLFLLLATFCVAIAAKAQSFSIAATTYPVTCSNTCDNGAAVLTYQNNSGIVTYSVAPTNACTQIGGDSITGLSVGIYTVTATTGGGSTTSAVVVITQGSSGIGIQVSSNVACTNGILNQTVTLSAMYNSIGPVNTQYCSSVSNDAGMEDITSVTIGSMTQTSACGSTGGGGSIAGRYSNYLNQTITTTPGGTLPMSITIDTCTNTGAATTQTAIFVDINIDGDFSDVGEKVYSGGAIAGPHTISGTINIPNNATVGVTRLRIINAEATAIQPCGPYLGGETEDYALVIGNPVAAYNWTNQSGSLSTTNTYVAAATASTYTLSITDASGCTQTSSVTISTGTAPNVTVVSTNSLCSYATAEATVTNGPATVTWQPGGSTNLTITNLTTTTYTCTAVGANGCASASTVFVAPKLPITDNGNITHVLCSGTSTGAIQALISGGSLPYTYAWSPAPASGTNNFALNLPANTYTLNVTDAVGCTKSITYTITQSANPLLVGIIQFNISGPGANDGRAYALPSGGTPPYTYLWEPAGVTTDSIANCSPTVYTITVTDSKGCSVQSTVNMHEPGAMSISDEVSHNNIALQPNPTNGTTLISASSALQDIVVYNAFGQKVQMYEGIKTNSYTLELQDLPNGLYYIKCMQGKSVSKLIKQQ
jgi:hypothetical protein